MFRHSSCKVALVLGQGRIVAAPRDYKRGRSSPLSDAWARSGYQHRWRRPARWAGRVTLALLVLAFLVAYAQAPAGPGGMGHGGMMQQMGALMKQMSEMMGTK